MDRIRLIASDMDATLLDGHSQLPPDFLHLVQELAGQALCAGAAKTCSSPAWSRRSGTG